jgi:hypothetical protein
VTDYAHKATDPDALLTALSERLDVLAKELARGEPQLETIRAARAITDLALVAVRGDEERRALRRDADHRAETAGRGRQATDEEEKKHVRAPGPRSGHPFRRWYS